MTIICGPLARAKQQPPLLCPRSELDTRHTQGSPCPLTPLPSFLLADQRVQVIARDTDRSTRSPAVMHHPTHAITSQKSAVFSAHAPALTSSRFARSTYTTAAQKNDWSRLGREQADSAL